MRHIFFMLPSLALFLLALALPGCAGTRAAKTADTAPSRPAGEGQAYASLGRYADPDFLFDSKSPAIPVKTLRVKAMAYTACSVGKKRKKARHAPRGAWGDALTPEVKAVAVSPDLLEMGLDHGDVIAIEGLPGRYKVLDVMGGRHDKTIDIYYGEDECGAVSWGKRTLTISWQ